MLKRYVELLEGVTDESTKAVLATVGDVYSLWTLLTHTGTLYQGMIFGFLKPHVLRICLDLHTSLVY